MLPSLTSRTVLVSTGILDVELADRYKEYLTEHEEVANDDAPFVWTPGVQYACDVVASVFSEYIDQGEGMVGCARIRRACLAFQIHTGTKLSVLHTNTMQLAEKDDSINMVAPDKA